MFVSCFSLLYSLKNIPNGLCIWWVLAELSWHNHLVYSTYTAGTVELFWSMDKLSAGCCNDEDRTGQGSKETAFDNVRGSSSSQWKKGLSFVQRTEEGVSGIICLDGFGEDTIKCRGENWTQIWMEHRMEETEGEVEAGNGCHWVDHSSAFLVAAETFSHIRLRSEGRSGNSPSCFRALHCGRSQRRFGADAWEIVPLRSNHLGGCEEKSLQSAWNWISQEGLLPKPFLLK